MTADNDTGLLNCTVPQSTTKPDENPTKFNVTWDGQIGFPIVNTRYEYVWLWSDP